MYHQDLLESILFCNIPKIYDILHTSTISKETVTKYFLYYIQEVCLKSDCLDQSSSTSKKFEVIYAFIDHGANIDAVDENGNTSLYYAVYYRITQLCEILLLCGADMWANDSNQKTGMSIYRIACRNMRAMPQLYLVFDKYYPGLWKAVESEDIFKTRKLINFWCRTNLYKGKKNLKDAALETGNEEIIDLILGIYETMNLIYHIYAKNTKAVKNLLETQRKKIRLDLRKLSDRGAPILYYLIKSKYVSCIELFMQHGCQIYTIMQDECGYDMPVLFTALQKDMTTNVLEKLLPKEKPQQEEILYKLLYKGKTVLEVALESKVSEEVLELLIERGGPLLLCDRNQFNQSVRDLAVIYKEQELFNGENFYQAFKEQQYVQCIDQCVLNWMSNPNECDRKEKLALYGWKLLPPQCPKETANELQKFIDSYNLLQAHIKQLASCIEESNVTEFIEIMNKPLFSQYQLWYARSVETGIPLLHWAVLFSEFSIVELILEMKPVKESIDNLLDPNHRTALHYAFALSSTRSIQKLLFKYGCSEHVLDRTNKEPLDFKSEQDSFCNVKIIDRLKNKKFCESEPNPWTADSHSEFEYSSDELPGLERKYMFSNRTNDDSESDYYDDMDDKNVPSERNNHYCLIS